MDEMEDWEWTCSHDPDQAFESGRPFGRGLESYLFHLEVYENPRLRGLSFLLLWTLFLALFFAMLVPS